MSNIRTQSLAQLKVSLRRDFFFQSYEKARSSSFLSLQSSLLSQFPAARRTDIGAGLALLLVWLSAQVPVGPE